jgi:hypothetical protein
MRDGVLTDGNIWSSRPGSSSEIRSSVSTFRRYNGVHTEVTPDIFHNPGDASSEGS